MSCTELIFNTRYANAAGTVLNNFVWAIHSDKFSNSYAVGKEVVSQVMGAGIGDAGGLAKSKQYTNEKVAEVEARTDQKLELTEKVTISAKNLFNPKTVILGSCYNNLGALIYNAAYRRSIKYPCVAGEWISISGMNGIRSPNIQTHMQFWRGDGSQLVSLFYYPSFDTTTAISIQAPDGATFFSLNVNSSIIPPKLQIEKAQKPTAFEPYYIPVNGLSIGNDVGEIIKSSKNLYDGIVQKRSRNISSGIQFTSNDNDAVTSFIPVEYGKYYTISGLDLNLIETGTYLRVLGYSSNITNVSTFVKTIPANFGNVFTIYIDDPLIKYIVLPLTSSTKILKSIAEFLPIQVEEGQTATDYQPFKYEKSALMLSQMAINESLKKVKLIQPKVISNFVELNAVRSAKSTLTPFIKDVSPMGISYAIEANVESAVNTLFSQTKILESGKKSIYANLMKYVSGAATLGVLKGVPFTVPSGQFDNEGTLSNYAERYAKYDYCHPDIAYDPVGVAGFKYWMISSVLPANNMGDVTWEDEDLFVSNDAKTWQRVRSLYESDKTYTTTNLRLPPQSLAVANARKFSFLPCPGAGDTVEISVAADNGGAALDRVNVTLSGLPWKHDPAIIIDGGYVYTYHSFHLSYPDRPGGQNRFMVCVRTSDGISWEVVRPDGSTMLLTEENSRKIFTKDDQGRFNYMFYAYNRGSYQNPRVIKWGNGDYELYYGENFSFRLKGTTPYNFDFSVTYPIGAIGGSPNHPIVLKDGDMLYLVNNNAVYSSNNRGQTLTKLPYYPMWLGGITGIPYKKAMCIGEGGKVILVEAQRFNIPAYQHPGVNGFTATNDENLLFIYEYASVSDFINKAQNGLIDAYADFQLCRVNYETQKREYLVLPAVGLNNVTSQVNRPLQRVKVAEMDFKEGDLLLLYVTLNSRNGAEIVFGGMDIV